MSKTAFPFGKPFFVPAIILDKKFQGQYNEIAERIRPKAGVRAMKNTRLILAFIPRYCYSLFEKKLSDLSRKGWSLVNYGHLFYRFERTTPKDKKYFILFSTGGYRRGDGIFDIELRHPNLKRYASKKSALNKITLKKNKSPMIFEVDQSKIDLGFNELTHDRNKWQYLELLRESLLFILGFTGSYFLTSHRLFKTVFLILDILLALNLIVGLFFYIYSKKREKP
ncbi:MAG: DUF2812 domain-containing protein [Clostridia bacterium]|nr:DUF2812 domain-containing protein [Clostridia bacterium]